MEFYYFKARSNLIFVFFVFLSLIYCHSPSSFSQGILGTFTEKSSGADKIFLWELIGHNSYVIDSAEISKDGRFFFKTDKLSEGYYFLFLNDTSRADLIISPSEKEIVLEFTSPQLQYGVNIISSEENKLLWEYKLISKAVYNELKSIYVAKSYLPVPPQTASDSLMHYNLQRSEDSLNDFKMQHLKRICEARPGSFFARSARSALRKNYESREDQKLHFFETVDFNDAALIRSNALPSNMMEYLQKYTEYHEDGFKSSVDTVLSKAKANSQVYEFCLNYLLALFDRVGPDVTFQYLSEKYLIGEGCSDEGVSQSFKEKAEAYRLLLPGNLVPQILLRDTDGKERNISEIAEDNKLTIVFFWSSHCNFCHKAIPALKELFSEYNPKGLEILAISLDENKNDWERYISENDLKWINVCDLKGWKSESVLKFKIHKTPYFYLIDSHLKILSKPGTVEEVGREVAKYF